VNFGKNTHQHEHCLETIDLIDGKWRITANFNKHYRKCRIIFRKKVQWFTL